MFADARRYEVGDLVDSVRDELRRERYRAFRRALRHAGYTPGSVQLAVARDREWLESGKAEREEG